MEEEVAADFSEAEDVQLPVARSSADSADLEREGQHLPDQYPRRLRCPWGHLEMALTRESSSWAVRSHISRWRVSL